MKISEIFYSLQGEGILAGVPSVFIRTSGCNLRCAWCDTPYTSWYPEGEEKSLGEILSDVRRRWAKHAVVTGGEPMIAPEIVALTTGLKQLDLHVTVETAGTVFQPVACDLMSISPKLSNSTPRKREGGRWADQHERLRWQPDVIRKLMAEYPYQLKFVVAKPDDVYEVMRVVEELGAEPERVLLMPEGITPEETWGRSEWIVQACKQEKFRFCPRLHIDLFGNVRGT